MASRYRKPSQDSPDRSKASAYAADEAIEKLKIFGYDPQFFEQIHHAILSHSFSANIPPQTLEAKIVQDADRLDALGAIGIARMFSVGGKLNRALFDSNDPLAEGRSPDDTRYTLDHLKIKIYGIVDTLNTQTARIIAKNRIEFMVEFSARLKQENAGLL